jgi:integrative and conjugative element protein (TIGR02256 family)
MTVGIVFRTRDGKRLKLDDAVLERFALYRQVAPHHHEAGGVLLGRHLLDSSDIVVDEITEPMAGDSRSRFRFRRGQWNHQRRIDEAWLASRGTCVYLGEWHTHPEADPTPSSTDLHDWRRRLRTDAFGGDALYFLILGVRAVRAWEGARGSLAINPMALVR